MMPGGELREGHSPAPACERRQSAATRGIGVNVFDRQRWKEVPLDVIPSAPGMLGIEELQFLYFAAREFYSGSGEIVDAGAFLGALAAGLRDNPTVSDKSKRIFSYDFFAFDDFYRRYLPDDERQRGDDTLPLFHAFTRNFREQITAHKADICRQ